MDEEVNYSRKLELKRMLGYSKMSAKNQIVFSSQIKKSLVPTSSLKALNHLMAKLRLKMEKVSGFQILNHAKIVIIFDQQ